MTLESFPEDFLDETNSSTPPRSTRKRSILEDDLDVVEREDRGVDLTEGSTLARVFANPDEVQFDDDDSAAYTEADETAIEEAERLDLEQFARGGSGIEWDAFEDWVRLSRKYGNLKLEEIDKLVEMMRCGDPELQSIAEERLVCHSIRWIVRTLRRVAGPRIMDRPSDLRNDVLSVGRMGFLMGLRKYDPELAIKRGAQGHKKSLLHFTDYWIEKYFREAYARDVLGLNPDAAEDRNLVLRAVQSLRESLGREPTIAEISVELEDRARERLARKQLRRELGRKPTTEEMRERIQEHRQVRMRSLNQARRAEARKSLSAELGREPTREELAARLREIRRNGTVTYSPPTELRRAGALPIKRIRDLLRHQTVQESLDAPAVDDEDGRTLAEYLAHEGDEPEDRIAVRELARAISARIERVRAGGPRGRELFRMREGLLVEGKGIPYPNANYSELAVYMGRSTRDSALAVSNQIQRELRGEILVDPDLLRPADDEFSPARALWIHGEIREAESELELLLQKKAAATTTNKRLKAEKQIAQTETRLRAAKTALAAFRARVAAQVSLFDLMIREGLSPDSHGRMICPLSKEQNHLLQIHSNSFECESCGISGGIVEWLQARRGISVEEADLEAARIALALPNTLEREGGKVVVIQDPVRRRRLHGLQA